MRRRSFSMMILPRFVFVNVQVTSSTGSTSIVAVASPTSTVLGVSLEPYPAVQAWIKRFEALPGFFRLG